MLLLLICLVAVALCAIPYIIVTRHKEPGRAIGYQQCLASIARLEHECHIAGHESNCDRCRVEKVGKAYIIPLMDSTGWVSRDYYFSHSHGNYNSHGDPGIPRVL